LCFRTTGALVVPAFALFLASNIHPWMFEATLSVAKLRFAPKGWHIRVPRGTPLKRATGGQVARILALSFGALLAAGCGLRARDDLVLPPAPPNDACQQYAVIEQAHLFLHAAPMHDAEITSIVRRGTILRILDKDLDKDIRFNAFDYWYDVADGTRRGWIFGNGMSIYCHEYQAELRKRTALVP